MFFVMMTGTFGIEDSGPAAREYCKWKKEDFYGGIGARGWSKLYLGKNQCKDLLFFIDKMWFIFVLVSAGIQLKELK